MKLDRDAQSTLLFKFILLGQMTLLELEPLFIYKNRDKNSTHLTGWP